MISFGPRDSALSATKTGIYHPRISFGFSSSKENPTEPDAERLKMDGWGVQRYRHNDRAEIKPSKLDYPQRCVPVQIRRKGKGVSHETWSSGFPSTF